MTQATGGSTGTRRESFPRPDVEPVPPGCLVLSFVRVNTNGAGVQGPATIWLYTHSPSEAPCVHPPFREIQGPPCPQGPALSQEAPVLPGPLSQELLPPQAQGEAAPLGGRPAQVPMLGATVNSARLPRLELSLAGGEI